MSSPASKGINSGSSSSRAGPASPADSGTLKDVLHAAKNHPPPYTSPGATQPIGLWRGAGRIVAFFLLFGALAWGLDSLIDNGFRRIETSGFGTTNNILSGSVNADVVISGSSRAMVHYDPRILQSVTGLSAYNIGRNGSQTDIQLSVLRAYLRHNAKPKLVLHNLDLFSFEISKDIYDPAQYIPYLHEESIYAGVKRVYPSAWKWRYVPLYAYAVEDMRFTWMTGLKGFFGYQPAEDHFRGFVPRYSHWTEDFDHFRQANPQGVTFRIEERGMLDLSEIIVMCQRSNIPIVLVYSPEFYEMQLLERNRDAIFAKFHDLADRFHIAFWDFSASPISTRKENFYNSQHLNASGAHLFTEELAQRLHVSRPWQ
jgi:hypothetical protein